MALWWRWALLICAAAAAFSAASVAAEMSPLVIVENRGNSSFECITSGRCVPCSLAEKQNEEIYHCSSTGYYMPYKCVQMTPPDPSSSVSAAEEELEKKSKPVFRGSVQKTQNPHSRKRLAEASSGNGGGSAEGKKIYHINKSCTPFIADDRLSVLGFEGIMLGMLAVSSPVLYYRKKRGFVPSGMTRIPTNIRF